MFVAVRPFSVFDICGDRREPERAQVLFSCCFFLVYRVDFPDESDERMPADINIILRSAPEVGTRSRREGEVSGERNTSMRHKTSDPIF